MNKIKTTLTAIALCAIAFTTSCSSGDDNDNPGQTGGLSSGLEDSSSIEKPITPSSSSSSVDVEQSSSSATIDPNSSSSYINTYCYDEKLMQYVPIEVCIPPIVPDTTKLTPYEEQKKAEFLDLFNVKTPAYVEEMQAKNPNFSTFDIGPKDYKEYIEKPLIEGQCDRDMKTDRVESCSSLRWEDLEECLANPAMQNLIGSIEDLYRFHPLRDKEGNLVNEKGEPASIVDMAIAKAQRRANRNKDICFSGVNMKNAYGPRNVNPEVDPFRCDLNPKLCEENEMGE